MCTGMLDMMDAHLKWDGGLQYDASAQQMREGTLDLID
jgi:hypothetical protein